MADGSSIKLHVVRGPHTGTDNCDFRGPNAVGAPQGDNHRTVLEIKNASDGLISETLTEGLVINNFFQKLIAVEPQAFEDVATALGLGGTGEPYLRVGVWTPGHDTP